MRRCSPSTVEGRTIIGVIALYALLLQAFLGFAAPVLAEAATGEILCVEHTGSAPADGKATTPCHPCCTVLQVGTLAPPPSANPVAVAWPSSPFARLVWRPEAARLTTGPPVFAASARGPPSA